MKLENLPANLLVGQVLKRLDRGDLDDHLQALIDRAVNRKRTVQMQEARRLAQTIKVGDEIKISPNIKPRYMSNLVGKVVGKSGTKLVVEFPNAVGRFGRRVRVPFTVVTLLRSTNGSVEEDIEIDL